MNSSCIGEILNRSPLSSFLVYEAKGFARGIWLMWNASVVNVELISMDDQFINAIIDNFLNEKWVLTSVYASPKIVFHQSLWLYLEMLGKVMNMPWFLLGDFNHILSSEKRGGDLLRMHSIR